MKKQEYTCIVFFLDKKCSPWKYRKIYNLNNFINFVKKINGIYINVYHKETKQFYKQIKV